MNKTTKGALAAAAAGVLLLGGAGTFAYWTSTQDVTGATISSGNMSIETPNCGSGWTIDGGEDAPNAAFNPASDKIVPGDVLTETCTTVFHGVGEHLRATLEATPGTSTGLFSSGQLTLGVSGLESSADGSTGWTAVPATGLTEDNDGDTVRVTLTVTFDGPSSNNSTQNVSSVLDAITIDATQVHA